MMKNWNCLVAVAVLTVTAACGRTNNAVGENRPDGAAVNRAAQVTNSSDNKEMAASDTAVTTQVQAKFLNDPMIKARRINVQTQEGGVTLSGSVMSKAESDKAEELAKDTEGVKRVVNNLIVETRP
jgi:osmotically-inducible protein OsmY